MDGLLVSYANAAADVAGHVAFGVDPPALADFFSAVVFRVRFESVQLPNRAAPPPLGKRLHFRDEAARTVTPHSTIRGRTGKGKTAELAKYSPRLHRKISKQI